MSRVLDKVAAAAMALAALSLVGMTLVQAWQVFARYVLNDAPGWTEPLALILMSFAVMLGAAVGVRAETHFTFQSLQHAQSQRVQKLLRSISRLIAAVSGLGLFFFGGFLMLDDWSVAMPGAPLPAGSRFLALTIGGALIFVFALERLFGPELEQEPEEAL